MLLYTAAQCREWLQTALLLSTSAINESTQGTYAANEPMVLDRSPYWLGPGFTPHFLRVGKRIAEELNRHCDSGCDGRKIYYRWPGAEVISQPVACYDHYKCQITVRSRAGGWAMCTTRTWLGDQLTEPRLGFASLKRRENSTQMVFKHTFFGPREVSVVFNKMQVISDTSPSIHRLVLAGLGTGVVCDLRYNGIPEGVFGLVVRNLSSTM